VAVFAFLYLFRFVGRGDYTPPPVVPPGTVRRHVVMPPYTRTIGGCFVGATLAVARTAAADVDLGDRKGRPYISLRT